MLRIAAVTFLTFALAACGGSGEDATEKFVGTWSYSSGTNTIKCPGEDAVTDVQTGTRTVEKGTDSDLLTTSSDGVCTLRLNLDGNVASAIAGQQCSDASDGTAVTANFTSFILRAEGPGLSVSGGANITVTTGGMTTACTTTVTGTLVRK